MQVTQHAWHESMSPFIGLRREAEQGNDGHKGLFQQLTAFSPHWPKSPPSFTTPPLLLLLHLLLNAPLLLILQPGFMKGLSLLLVLKSNEI